MYISSVHTIATDIWYKNQQFNVTHKMAHNNDNYANYDDIVNIIIIIIMNNSQPKTFAASHNQ